METKVNQSAQDSQGGSATHPRIEEFKRELGELDVKAPEDTGDRKYLLAGVALFVIGIIAILAGWFGASGTAFPNEQLPYLLSGGFLGLGFIVVGAALFVRFSMSRYLRFWLVREIYEQRAQTDRVVAAIEALGQAKPANRKDG
jgi:hypothetical protein